MKKLAGQILRFGAVGFFCFFVDYGVLLALTELAGIPYLISSGISFTVSVIVNYILSMRFVFDAGGNSHGVTEFLVFVILSAVGLGINQLVMWGTVEKLGIPYQIAKIGATAIVMVYNFISRKKVIER